MGPPGGGGAQQGGYNNSYGGEPSRHHTPPHELERRLADQSRQLQEQAEKIAQLEKGNGAGGGGGGPGGPGAAARLPPGFQPPPPMPQSQQHQQQQLWSSFNNSDLRGGASSWEPQWSQTMAAPPVPPSGGVPGGAPSARVVTPPGGVSGGVSGSNVPLGNTIGSASAPHQTRRLAPNVGAPMLAQPRSNVVAGSNQPFAQAPALPGGGLPGQGLFSGDMFAMPPRS
jgi:hypothetical protein